MAQSPDLGDLGEIRFIVEVTRRDGTIEHYDMTEFIVADNEDAPGVPNKECR